MIHSYHVRLDKKQLFQNTPMMMSQIAIITGVFSIANLHFLLHKKNNKNYEKTRIIE